MASSVSRRTSATVRLWKDGRRRPVACACSAAVWRTTGMANSLQDFEVVERFPAVLAHVHRFAGGGTEAGEFLGVQRRALRALHGQAQADGAVVAECGPAGGRGDAVLLQLGLAGVRHPVRGPR